MGTKEKISILDYMQDDDLSIKSIKSKKYSFADLKAMLDFAEWKREDLNKIESSRTELYQSKFIRKCEVEKSIKLLESKSKRKKGITIDVLSPSEGPVYNQIELKTKADIAKHKNTLDEYFGETEKDLNYLKKEAQAALDEANKWKRWKIFLMVYLEIEFLGKNNLSKETLDLLMIEKHIDRLKKEVIKGRDGKEDLLQAIKELYNQNKLNYSFREYLIKLVDNDEKYFREFYVENETKELIVDRLIYIKGKYLRS